jgi:hypothetical protein
VGSESPPALTNTVQQPIIGGQPDNGDPQVFEMFIVGDNGAGAYCSATLIAKRTLLTAAHCVDPRTIGANAITIYAHNFDDDTNVPVTKMTRVIDQRYHPNWNGVSGGFDIGLAQLEDETGVYPKPWNRASMSSMKNAPIRAIGYGATAGGNNPTGNGTRREVDLTIDTVYGSTFVLGDGQAHGICHGDSGGPSMFTFSDGVERIVGVHSYTSNLACTTGGDTRVDYYADFVDQWLLEKEPPSCEEDGRCATGCGFVDIDCVCPKDGQCTADCPDLNKDPDCPADCGINGVCSQNDCPIRDGDCAAPGTSCSVDGECGTGKCIGDDTAHYCSKQCSADGDCWAGATCDMGSSMCMYASAQPTGAGEICAVDSTLCATGYRCEGRDAGVTYCSQLCNTQDDCTAPDTKCIEGYDRLKTCQGPPKPVVTIGDGHIEKGPVKGCSVGSGLLPLLALASLLRRKHQRR